MLARDRVDVRTAPGPLLAREPVDERCQLFVTMGSHAFGVCCNSFAFATRELPII